MNKPLRKDNPDKPYETSGFASFGDQSPSQFGANPNSQFGGGGQDEFGTGPAEHGTNTISQIFKDTGNGDDGRKRAMIWGGLLLFVCVAGIALWMLGEEPKVSPPKVTEAPKPAAPAVPAEAVAPPAPAPVEAPVAPVAPVPAPAATSYTYNEADGGPVVDVPEGSVVEVSRDAAFGVPYVVGIATNGKFRIPNPPPPEIHWRIQGQGQANTITIVPPPTLNISFSMPSTLSQGTKLSWNVEGPAIFFRVEFGSSPLMDSLVGALTTGGNSVTVSGIPPGQHHARLGAFNKAAGKWQYTPAKVVTVE